LSARRVYKSSITKQQTDIMRWGLGRNEKGSTSSNDDVQYVQNYPGANEALSDHYDPNNVPCPAHTTERKLLRRIDLHVIPWLVLLYWLAFLDRYGFPCRIQRR
jgi:hypothetical protein